MDGNNRLIEKVLDWGCDKVVHLFGDPSDFLVFNGCERKVCFGMKAWEVQQVAEKPRFGVRGQSGVAGHHCHGRGQGFQHHQKKHGGWLGREGHVGAAHNHHRGKGQTQRHAVRQGVQGGSSEQFIDKLGFGIKASLELHVNEIIVPDGWGSRSRPGWKELSTTDIVKSSDTSSHHKTFRIKCPSSTWLWLIWQKHERMLRKLRLVCWPRHGKSYHPIGLNNLLKWPYHDFSLAILNILSLWLWKYSPKFNLDSFLASN